MQSILARINGSLVEKKVPEKLLKSIESLVNTKEFNKDGTFNSKIDQQNSYFKRCMLTSKHLNDTEPDKKPSDLLINTTSSFQRTQTPIASTVSSSKAKLRSVNPA